MRAKFNFGSSVADSDLVAFGQSLCQGAQAGEGQADLQSLAKTNFSNTSATDAYSMVLISEQNLCPGQVPVPKWHTIAVFTGNGDTNTSKFTISPPGDWVMKYSYNCSGQLIGTGNFIVNEDAMNNMNSSAVAINRLDAGAQGAWHVYGDAGQHYLQIQTQCPYTIRVRQKY
jgi:uncharacterized protein DUF732